MVGRNSLFVWMLVLVGVVFVRGQDQESGIASFLRRDLANELLGVTDYQDTQWIFPSTAQSLDGSDEIARLAVELGIVLEPYIAAMGRLTREIELQFGDPRSLDSSVQPPVLAEDVNETFTLTYNERLNTDISVEGAPIKQAPSVNESSILYKQSIFASTAGVPVMKLNWETFPNLRYQYFASEHGFTRYFPAYQWDDDRDQEYDGRLESWYANAAAGPKTVVLLIRRGYDYGDALVPFLSTFSDKDFLQIISYGLDDYELSDCFETVPLQMFRTDARMKSVLWDFIETSADRSYQRSEANLTMALGAGFDTVLEMFNNPTAVTCLPAIVWLPAPDDTADNDLRLYAQERNEELTEISRPAQVFIYEDDYNEFSHRITCESSGEYYNYGNNETALAFRLARYYMIVAQSVRADDRSALFAETAQFTFGYSTFITSTFRPDGKDYLDGLSLTLVQPAYSGRTLIGCIGMDIDFMELQDRLSAEQKGMSGKYSISNQQADTLVHPQVAPANQQEPESLLDLRFVEITPAFYNIRTGVVQLSTGDRQIVVISAAFEEQEVTIPSTYYWTAIPGVPMTVILSRVVGETETAVVEPFGYQLDDSYNYLVSSNIQYLDDDDDLAGISFSYSNELDASVTYDSAIYLLPPSSYVDLNDPKDITSTIANNIHAYLNDFDNIINQYITEFAKTTIRVLATSDIDDFWMANDNSLVLSRCVVLKDGTTSMYPGRANLPATTDWRDTDWYKRSSYFIEYPVSSLSVAEPTLTLTEPIANPTGDLMISTLSAPIYHPGVYGYFPVGVMSMEMRFIDFWEQMLDSLDDGDRCRRSRDNRVYGSGTDWCILIDHRVQILGSADTYDRAVNGNFDADSFLGAQHPGLARYLFDEGLLVRESRIDYVDRLQGEKYFVDDRLLGTPYRGSLDYDDCASADDLDLLRVEGTTFYLIILSSDYEDDCSSFDNDDSEDFRIDVCEDISFTYRSAIRTENCMFPLVFLDSVLDTVRESYAYCEGLGKYFIIDWVRYEDPLAIAFVTITALTQVLIIALMIWVFLHQTSPVIRMASPIFCEFILAGCIIALCTIYFLTGEPTTNICRARAWFFCLGFSLAFAALFAKTWRIHKIYLSAMDFQNKPISPVQLMGIMALAMAPTIILLALWSGIHPLGPETIEDDTNSDKLILQCQSDNQWVWQGCLIAVNGILVLYSCYVTIITRKIRLMFNESRYIGLAIYNVAVFATVGIALGAGLENNLEAWYAILCGTILAGTILMILVLFMSKLKLHYLTPEKNTLEGQRAQSQQTGGTTMNVDMDS